LYADNFASMATQAAVFAGFTTTCLVELYVPKSNNWVAVYFLHISAIISICSNITCVSLATITSIWGSGKALRGIDGSMDEAVDAMNSERPLIFNSFALGLAANLCTVCATCVIMMDFPFVILPLGIVLYTCWMIASNALRIQKRFHVANTIRLDDLTKFPDHGKSETNDLIDDDVKSEARNYARYRKSQQDFLV
jgi:hypothetical protein